MCLCVLEFQNHEPQNVWHYQTVTSGLLSLNTRSNGSDSTLKMILTPTQMPTRHQDINANRFDSVLGWSSVEELRALPEIEDVKRAG